MADIERFDRALTPIDEHPELHRQNHWLMKLDCGTGGCLAGHIVMQEYPDGVPAVLEPGLMGDFDPQYGVINFDALLLPDGTLVDVDKAAQKLLGIDDEQADVVFDVVNTAGDLHTLRDVLAADHDADWDALHRAVSR